MPDAQEVEESVFQCQGCGAILHYSPGTAVLKCQYCGREHDLKLEAKPIVEHDIEELKLVPFTSQQGFGAPARQFKCEFCGAVTALPGAITATKCAFCGSSVVVETKLINIFGYARELGPVHDYQKSCISQVQGLAQKALVPTE